MSQSLIVSISCSGTFMLCLKSPTIPSLSILYISPLGVGKQSEYSSKLLHLCSTLHMGLVKHGVNNVDSKNVTIN